MKEGGGGGDGDKPKFFPSSEKTNIEREGRDSQGHDVETT